MKKLNKITLNAMLAVIAVAVSALEGFLPVLSFMPPGAKLGLSNIVSMYASKVLGIYYALGIVLVKSLFVLATRGVTAFFMSISGGLVSTVITAILLNKENRKTGFVGIGIIGAVTHNTAQITVAALITNSGVFYYIPFLVLASCITGFVTGVLLYILLKTVKIEAWRER